MLNIKKLVSLSFAIPLFSAISYGSASQQTQSEVNTLSLEELKHHCLQMRQNDQMEPFSIRVECSGQYTYWSKEESSVARPESSVMTANTSTKCRSCCLSSPAFAVFIPTFTSIWSKFRQFF